MTKHVPLASDKHAKLRIIKSHDYTRFQKQNIIPIVVGDFFTLSAEFALAFVTNQGTEDFMPVAVMGLRDGENLYCQENPFPAQVVPLGFGNAPFAIAATDENREKFVVLIDEDSELLSETEGQALFNEEGEKSDYTEARVEGLVKAAQQREKTNQVCKLLSDKGLLTTHQVRLQHRPDGQRYNIEGMYIVDEQKVNDLSDEEYLELRKLGLLPLIYAHLTSLSQLRRVSEKQYEADKAEKADKEDKEDKEEKTDKDDKKDKKNKVDKAEKADT